MFLLSMTLAPNYKQYGLWNRVGLGTLLTDETFGVAITPYIKGEKINDRWLHGLNITAYLFWTISCVAGALFGKYISNPNALGLDYAITAMFIFLGISQFESVKKSRFRIYHINYLCNHNDASLKFSDAFIFSNINSRNIRCSLRGGDG